MRVFWSEAASADVYRIFLHILESNPSAAHSVLRQLYQGCSSLESLSKRGRPSRVRGRRELVFQSLPYIAIYRVHKDSVEILHIYHSAQDWP